MTLLFGRFLDPILFSRYPQEMIEILDDTLPEFSLKEQKILKKSGLDFIGVNHYTSYYVQDCLLSVCNEPGKGTTKTEGYYRQSSTRNGVPIGQLVSKLAKARIQRIFLLRLLITYRLVDGHFLCGRQTWHG